MANAISLEYLQSIKGVANGLASLDANGTIPVSELPDIAIQSFKGQFADEAALNAAYPVARLADYAYVTGTLSFWYWNAMLAAPAWVNQEISVAAYTALSASERSAVPYIIIP